MDPPLERAFGQLGFGAMGPAPQGAELFHELPHERVQPRKAA